MLLRRLVSLYKPGYIFCNKGKNKKINLYNSILNFKSYALYKRKKNEKYIFA